MNVQYVIRDHMDNVVFDLIIDIDEAAPLEVDDHVFGDDGTRYRILGFRHVDETTHDVLTEPDPEQASA